MHFGFLPVGSCTKAQLGEIVGSVSIGSALSLPVPASPLEKWEGARWKSVFPPIVFP